MNLSVRFLNAAHVKQTLARAIISSLLLVLSSCVIAPYRPAEPSPGVPETFKGEASPENSAQLSTAEFFNDPILNGLIGQALIGNRELKILEEEVQIASNEILARRGAYFPFLNLGANASALRPSLYTFEGSVENQLDILPGQPFPNPLPNFLFGVNLFWQLDIWRELRNARDAAGQRYLAAIERRNYFVTRLVAEIADNYYGLMARDKRLENLDRVIELQEQSLKIARARLAAGRGTELAVQRFLAEVRKNQSQKLITYQEIVEVENRINFLVNRFPQPVERNSTQFFELNMPLNVGVPAQLLQNRPDIRQAERELEAAGLDVKVARAHFYPKVVITGGVGTAAFNPRFLFTPESLLGSVAGDLITPLINKKAIRAEYLTANARQLETVYNYQRVILNAFTEVINRMSKVENYSRSVAIKNRQVKALESSVAVASNLFQNARVEYIDVLFAQRDLWEARLELIDTRQQQLSAIVNTYQALGGGVVVDSPRFGPPVEVVPPELIPPELVPPKQISPAKPALRFRGFWADHAPRDLHTIVRHHLSKSDPGPLFSRRAFRPGRCPGSLAADLAPGGKS